MNRSLSLSAAIAFLAISISALPGYAGEQKYVEDFTTNQYKDALNTTAQWDTVAGELKLFRFVSTIIGTCDTPGVAWNVVVSGNYAFVADQTSGLQIVDISDSANPTLAGALGMSGLANDVTVSGDYAYLADYTSGLQVIDISVPTTPTLAGTCDTPGYAWGVTISGDYAFVADGDSGLQVVDISDPTNPTLAGAYSALTSARAVTVSGNYAYVADYTSGLHVIDISDPTVPSLAGSYDTPGSAVDVTVSGDNAYVADYTGGLQVIDISDPTNPMLAGVCSALVTARGVTVSGDRAYVADDVSGLRIVDISDPTAPTLDKTCDTPGNAYGVAVAGNHAFVADEGSGLQVIEISFPSSILKLTGSYDTPGQALGLTVAGDHVFLTDGSSGLHVIDISDPEAPVLGGGYNTPGTARDVAVSGNHAYVADHGSGLQVIDISDPASPTLAGSYDTPGYSYSVVVSGDHAFVADNSYGLQVLDISDPTNPVFAGSCDTPGNARGIVLAGDHAYMADGSYGLQVIDISDPASPTLAGTCDTPGDAQNVALSGDLAFVADYGFFTPGLQVIDISDPTSPTILENDYIQHEVIDISICGDFAFLCLGPSGIEMIDISDPASPTFSGNYSTHGITRSLFVSGKNVYVADDDDGLQVIEVFGDDLHGFDDIGWSLAVDDAEIGIFKARITTAQSDSVAWELSADGGVNWQWMMPDGNWNQITVPGTDLLWRSTLSWEALGGNPVVTGLQIDWLVAAACIDSIVDVPDDQGRSVNFSFTRSGYDFLDETQFPVVGYAIYRRLDDPLLAQQVMNQPGISTDDVLDHPQLASFGSDRVRMLADRTFILDSAASTVGALPPGIWEGVGWILPTQSDSYSLRVNTLADSTVNGTGWSVFVTAVHTTTPEIWYVSEPDSGYSVDNIAPGVPLGLAVAYNTGSGNDLSWDAAPESDFQYYRIYRGDSEGFIPGPGTLVHQTATPEWTDPDYDGWDVYYKVTTLDLSGNESAAASAGTTTEDDTPPAPEAFALHQNVPNPFNPATTIRFDLPQATHVNLSIFNVKGELVSTVADRRMSEGHKEFTWRGVDNRGAAVSSGMYFYRLVAGEFVQTRKMVLLR